MTDDKNIRLAWFNFLKAFTRGLVQINLYKPGHPRIEQVLENAHALLGPIIEDSPGGKFTLTLDNDELLINGSPVLTADKLPNSLMNLFSHFQASDISFLAGVSQDDIRLLCQMQSFDGDSREYLTQKNIDKITFTRAVRPKADRPETNTGAAQEPEASGTVSETAGEIEAAISLQDFKTAITTVIARTIRNAAEQKRLTEIVIGKFQTELETQTDKAVAEMRREKEKVENDIARTEAVISNIADGVVIVDKDGRILMMNPQAEVITGKGLSDLSGQKIFDIEQLGTQLVSLAWEIENGGAAEIPGSRDQKGKSDFSETVKKSTAIIQNEDGKIVGSVSIPTDKAMFREMERLQQDFIANMTHELRSPLTSIKAALEILARNSKPDDPAKNMLNTAIRNSERLNSIITDILDFSKLQSGKLIFHQENAQPDEIAREAADALPASKKP